MIIYKGTKKFKRFYIRDLFTNELTECTEKDFNDLVITFRNLYTLEYTDNGNTQLFYSEGILEAKRSRK